MFGILYRWSTKKNFEYFIGEAQRSFWNIIWLKYKEILEHFITKSAKKCLEYFIAGVQRNVYSILSVKYKEACENYKRV